MVDDGRLGVWLRWSRVNARYENEELLSRRFQKVQPTACAYEHAMGRPVHPAQVPGALAGGIFLVYKRLSSGLHTIAAREHFIITLVLIHAR